MSSVTPTANVDIDDVIVKFEEPTVGGNTVGAPTLTPLPLVDNFNETKAWQNDAVNVFGKSDIHDIVRSKRQNTVDLTYRLYETDFLRYGTELPNGSGTIAKTLTIIQPIKLNGSQFYKRYKGVITDTVNLTIGNFYTVSHTFVAQLISNYMTLDELKLDLGLATNASLVWPSLPTNTYWSSNDPNPTTKQPLVVDGNPYYLISMSASIERNPIPADATANETFFYIKSGYRGVSGNVQLYLTGKQLETLLDDFEKFTMSYKLNDDPNCDITMTGVVFTTKDEPKAAGDNSYIVQNLQFTATTFTVTAVSP